MVQGMGKGRGIEGLTPIAEIQKSEVRQLITGKAIQLLCLEVTLSLEAVDS